MTDTETSWATDVVLRPVPPGQVDRARAEPDGSWSGAIPRLLDGAPVAGRGPERVGEAEVPLDALLRSVRLTPRQTAYVAAEIVRALGVRHERGSTHGSVATSAIRVGLRSGRVRLVDPQIAEEPEDWLLRTTPLGAEQLRRADLHAAAATVAGLTDDTRTPAAQRDPRRLALLTALDDLGAALTAAAQGTDGGQTPARLTALSLVTGPRGRYPGAQEELAALAARVGGLDSSSGPPPAHVRGPLAADPAPRPARDPPSDLSVWTVAKRALARFSILLAALSVLAIVISLEFRFLGHKLTGDVHQLTVTGAGPAAKIGRTAPGGARGLPPLPVLGPGAAGSVTGIDLRAVGVCKPDSRCLLRIVAAVQPRRAGQSVSWNIVIVDRCTGARTAGPSGKIPVPAAAGTGSAVTTVALPHRVVALVAETGTPGHAASTALPVPARGGSC